jgi:hypothetical protein
LITDIQNRAGLAQGEPHLDESTQPFVIEHDTACQFRQDARLIVPNAQL